MNPQLRAQFRTPTFSRFASALKRKASSLGGAMRFPSFGSGAMSGGLAGFLMKLLCGSSYDYSTRAGNLFENSVVGIALNWLQRTFPEAPVCVEKLRGGKWQGTFEHELLFRLANPNPFYDEGYLWDATLLSWIEDGNAYWIKIRSPYGKVVELWWVPWWMMAPVWDESGDEFISHYEYTVNGKTFEVDVRDVVHFRNGVDPRNTRKGLTDLHAQKREIAGDNEVSQYYGALMFNMGIPAVIFTPEAAIEPPTEEENEGFKRAYKEKFSGKRRGEPLVLHQPWKLHSPGLSPENLALDKVLKYFESRIAAALGIPAVVLGLLVGLETSTAKASYRDSLYQAYISCIMPLHRKFNSQLTRQLMGDFGNPNRERLARDYTAVAALAEDIRALYKALKEACGRPFMTVNEARGKAKLPTMTGWDELKEESAGKANTGQPQKDTDDEEADNEDDNK